MSREKYFIEVEVRDENGKILETKKGEHTIKETKIQFELSVKDDKQLEFKMRELTRTLKAWLPKNYNINLGASIFVNVSGDGYYMNMFSLYGSEDRFVKH